MAKEDTLTAFERAQLDEMKRHHAAIEAAQAKPQPIVDMTSPTQQYEAMVRDRKGDFPGAPRVADPTVVAGCRSYRSDCTFDAKVDHRGVVVDLLNYEWTDRHAKKVDDGGLVPNPFSMIPPNDNLYKHWRWEFRREDINEYVGRPLPDHVRPKARPEVTT